ncbi:MAG: cyclic nucleotide-binding domain-containing protein [Gammaproteobacteria bacterium]
MRKVLIIFGELTDSDIEWMCDAGHTVECASGDRLIEAGHSVHELSLVLRGELGVYAGEREIALLGEGEIIGELSFLDARPPYASVIATEPSVVLSVPHDAVHGRFTRDPAFAGRFYRSLGIFMASRLRQTVGQLGVLPEDDALGEDDTSIDEIDPAVLDRSAIAGRRFERVRTRLGVE